jgi:hypothetical protein
VLFGTPTAETVTTESAPSQSVSLKLVRQSAGVARR